MTQNNFTHILRYFSNDFSLIPHTRTPVDDPIHSFPNIPIIKFKKVLSFCTKAAVYHKTYSIIISVFSIAIQKKLSFYPY